MSCSPWTQLTTPPSRPRSRVRCSRSPVARLSAPKGRVMLLIIRALLASETTQGRPSDESQPGGLVPVEDAPDVGVERPPDHSDVSSPVELDQVVVQAVSDPPQQEAGQRYKIRAARHVQDRELAEWVEVERLEVRVSPVGYAQHRPIRRVVARENSEEAGDLLIVDAPKARVEGQVLGTERGSLGFEASPVQSVAGRPGFIQRQAVRPRECGLELESGLRLKLRSQIAVEHQRPWNVRLVLIRQLLVGLPMSPRPGVRRSLDSEG